MVSLITVHQLEMDVLDLSYKIFTLYHRCLLDFLSFAVYFICLLCIFSLSISTICLWIGVRFLPSPFLPLNSSNDNLYHDDHAPSV